LGGYVAAQVLGAIVGASASSVVSDGLLGVAYLASDCDEGLDFIRSSFGFALSTDMVLLIEVLFSVLLAFVFFASGDQLGISWHGGYDGPLGSVASGAVDTSHHQQAFSVASLVRVVGFLLEVAVSSFPKEGTRSSP
jgi:glycerol uptake facilitator-like aquaporin